ncbi:TPA: ABC transporter ATP-binding protein [Listeria monocytogenes]|uniref:ABC transporter ATP-binding protein n=5 Tax=Listeria monocytogenes TaxID=1639 RepID=A0A3A7AXP5_LISMN|nr:ABC transporter ATP-binding protein [Listeria monocytogenes]EAA0165552.1 ABC transporter ATP-binding protein [Listeria monocytogenes serotype 1/2a]EAD3236432.1 ABC transporter ATP-binding protein [Listeria monocytogenes CFSAN002202]EAE6023336.1 ABC transporter ATP-binding protein [Listeria monocytogenes serotype 3a]EAF4500066.1 ABC transporter ATP-binding protein [Listeria monocytogenes serotype 4b]EAG6256891.1 ABC transporter ATP-binding protein [Listeria monocytogenes CFSAN003807]EAG6269
MTETVLKLEHVTKKIGQKNIVHDISFDIHKGEVFGLLGPNGAGKTTIIRSIVGLIRRSEGTVFINGKNVDTEYKAAISEVGAIIENPEFYMYMSGWANLKQFARMSQKNITDEHIREIVELVKLTGAINQKVKTYSLGMRQRLGVAQALIHSPALLILDEPTNGLDPQGMAEFRTLIRDLATNGTSVLISSHLLSEIQQITDRFAIINKGVLTHIEKMSDLIENHVAAYKLKVSDPVATTTVLATLPVKLVAQNEDLFKIEVAHEDVHLIARALIQANIDLLEMVPLQASLEERFLELTKGGGAEV